jgi:hypothetical protein
MFTVDGKERQYQMSANNFIHELFHSFNQFAGMGTMGPGSLFDLGQLVARVKSDNDENSVPDILESRNGVARQNTSMDDTEVLADLGLFYARGLINDESIREAYQVAIRQATIYHMTPEQRMGDLDTVMVQGQINTDGSNARVRSVPESDGYVLTGIPNTDENDNPTTAEVFGISPDGGWVYIHIPSGGYGWVSASLINVETHCLSILSDGDAGIDPTVIAPPLDNC